MQNDKSSFETDRLLLHFYSLVALNLLRRQPFSVRCRCRCMQWILLQLQPDRTNRWRVVESTENRMQKVKKLHANISHWTMRNHGENFSVVSIFFFVRFCLQSALARFRQFGLSLYTWHRVAFVFWQKCRNATKSWCARHNLSIRFPANIIKKNETFILL